MPATARPSPFERSIATLARFYGPPNPPPVRDMFGLILYENVAYLVDDSRRLEAFSALRKQVGLTPERILGASAEKLRAVAERGGVFAPLRVEKLRQSARLVLEEFGGDLSKVKALPLPEAVKALTRFPSIGEPGAEKILLFAAVHPLPALESNGLRVLLRLGIGEESRNYATSYRNVRRALTGQYPRSTAWLTRAHQLLRRHGQEICRRSAPACELCPLARTCAYRIARTPPGRRGRC